jgi:diguanylate cyclase (GGDEF)-like protein
VRSGAGPFPALRSGRPPALVLLDLDGFKEVNDTCGHEAGDRVLQEVAKRVLGAFDRDCLVARLGGDEFAVLVTGSARGRLPESVRKLGHDLRRPISLGPITVLTDASIGTAVPTNGDTTPTDLLRRADRAMYRAKSGSIAAGRGPGAGRQTTRLLALGAEHDVVPAGHAGPPVTRPGDPVPGG